jgi:phosphate transport system protein
MQTHFEHELEKLKKRVLKMANLAIEQVTSAINILFASDTEQIEKVVYNESIIDELDVKVDKLCQRIFVLKQPVATDLRFIMSSLRIGNELERIGDIAISIVNKSGFVRDQPEVLKQFEIADLFTETLDIIKKAVECYVDKDINRTREIICKSKEINEKCRLILELIISEMTTKSEIIIVATNLILILRQIERLADHSSNIAESVFFMVEGKIIKHNLKEISDKTEENKNNSDNIKY